jgi:hypothetical protein
MSPMLFRPEEICYIRIGFIPKIVQQEVGSTIFHTRNGQVTVELASFLINSVVGYPNREPRSVEERFDLWAKHLNKVGNGCFHGSDIRSCRKDKAKVTSVKHIRCPGNEMICLQSALESVMLDSIDTGGVTVADDIVMGWSGRCPGRRRC